MAKQPRTLEEAMAEIKKDFGDGSIHHGQSFPDIERIPFTIPEMNRMTYGGLPEGMLVEFYGEEGGGKTTTALNLIASAQETCPDKQCVFVDVERTFDPVWATKMGVNVEKLIIFSPEFQPAGIIFDACLKLLTDDVSVMVLDSLAAMISDQEIDRDVGERTYAGIAGELTRFSKKAVSACAKSKAIFIGINQLREEMNATYVSSRTPGGKGWKHFCSVRIEFKRGSFLDQDGKETSQQCENPKGHVIKARLVKSKHFPGDRKIVTYTLNYIHGLDLVADVLESAINLGIIEKKAAWLVWNNSYDIEVASDIKWNGRVKAQEELRENKEIFNALLKIVTELLLEM